jgi:hypothetical protein
MIMLCFTFLLVRDSFGAATAGSRYHDAAWDLPRPAFQRVIEGEELFAIKTAPGAGAAGIGLSGMGGVAVAVGLSGVGSSSGAC